MPDVPSLTASLVPALPYAAEAVDIFRQAEAAVSTGHTDDALWLIGSIEDAPLRSHFDAAMTESTSRWSKRRIRTTPLPFVEKSLRMPTVATQRSVFARDRWQCRWCTTPVVHRADTKAMTALYPDVLFDGPTNATKHGFILCSSASLDHVIPHSHGGTNELDNVVTACWPCQFGRGNALIEEMSLIDPRSPDNLLPQALL